MIDLFLTEFHQYLFDMFISAEETYIILIVHWIQH